MNLSVEQRLTIKFCFNAGKSGRELSKWQMQLMGTKHYPVRMFSDGMDDLVMDEKTVKATPTVAGLQSVAMTTISSRFLNYCFKTDLRSPRSTSLDTTCPSTVFYRLILN
jgi:hypothetical protein